MPLSFVVSHISRKTSEIWGTRHRLRGQISRRRRLDANDVAGRVLEAADGGEPVFSFVGQEGQELRYGLVALRVAEVRRDLGERRQDKASPDQRGVRQCQVLPSSDCVSQQEEVEIHDAGAVDDAVAAVTP